MTETTLVQHLSSNILCRSSDFTNLLFLNIQNSKIKLSELACRRKPEEFFAVFINLLWLFLLERKSFNFKNVLKEWLSSLSKLELLSWFKFSEYLPFFYWRIFCDNFDVKSEFYCHPISPLKIDISETRNHESRGHTWHMGIHQNLIVYLIYLFREVQITSGNRKEWKSKINLLE